MLRLPPALLLAVALAGCDLLGADPEPPSTPATIALTATDEAVVGQSNAFGVGLFARVAAEDGGNLMLSPLSASAALTMLLNGADGETYAQIHEMLGYGPALDLDAVNGSYESLRRQLLAADPAVRLALANAVFYDRTFFAAAPPKSPFLAALRGPFGAEVRDLDFGDPGAVDVVNGWASANTEGKVPKVLDAISRDLVMILMNALYFKGDWTTPFERSRTAPADFRLADGATVPVPTMSGEVQALRTAGDGYTAVELPYGRRNFSMVVLVPDSVGLGDFAARLDAGLWDDATTRLDAAADAWGPVEVRLPLFGFSYERELNEPLKALGMVDAFDDRRADLTRISDARLSVSFVKQNTFVEVNEEGTEAAAVTTVGVRATSAPAPFAVDRPFVFGLRERTTNTLLFIGQVADPRA